MSLRKPPQVIRTRPTNNQLLYRAIFKWQHYTKPLVGNPKLPDSTEACASVTSAFLQIINVLYEVEHKRQVGSRNILQLLASNTRKTKIAELNSPTHRVPEELKRHYMSDENGIQYSTNLDRNRYGSDEQYLATVVRHNLDFLEICPLIMDICILDAKGGMLTTCILADNDSCMCHSGSRPQQLQSADVRAQRQIMRTITNKLQAGDPFPTHPVDTGDKNGEAQKPIQNNTAALNRVLQGKDKAGGSDLFEALLAATADPSLIGNSKAYNDLVKARRKEPKTEDSTTEEFGPPRGKHTIYNSNRSMMTHGQPVALRRSSRRSKRRFQFSNLGDEDSDDSMDKSDEDNDNDDSSVERARPPLHMNRSSTLYGQRQNAFRRRPNPLGDAWIRHPSAAAVHHSRRQHQMEEDDDEDDDMDDDDDDSEYANGDITRTVRKRRNFKRNDDELRCLRQRVLQLEMLLTDTQRKEQRAQVEILKLRETIGSKDTLSSPIRAKPPTVITKLTCDLPKPVFNENFSVNNNQAFWSAAIGEHLNPTYEIKIPSKPSTDTKPSKSPAPIYRSSSTASAFKAPIGVPAAAAAESAADAGDSKDGISVASNVNNITNKDVINNNNNKDNQNVARLGQDVKRRLGLHEIGVTAIQKSSSESPSPEGSSHISAPPLTSASSTSKPTST